MISPWSYLFSRSYFAPPQGRSTASRQREAPSSRITLLPQGGGPSSPGPTPSHLSEHMRAFLQSVLALGFAAGAIGAAFFVHELPDHQAIFAVLAVGFITGLVALLILWACVRVSSRRETQ